jgi:4-hydroxyphenylacetate 3-monooxygenase/4-hydroxybutyryl-CoA dehydratase/vinylacetyl-CoA-Delta-isomerase
MAIGTKEAYIARLRKMKPNVYINGKAVDRSGSWIDGGTYVIGMTYDMSNNPEYEDVYSFRQGTAISW